MADNPMPPMASEPPTPRTGPAEDFASGGSRIPAWGPWAVIAGTALVLAGFLSLIGFNIALLAVGTVLVSIFIVYLWARKAEGRRQGFDRAITLGVGSLFALAMVPLVSLLYTVVSEGLSRMDPEFFSSSMRNVIGEGGGVLHAAVGTLIITGLATIAAVPIGIMAAVYLHEYGKGRLKRWLTFFVDVMTGIPSIVAGLFAFALFALIFGPGIRLGVMGSVALTVLMIPIVVRSTEEMLRVVPDGLREASFALGVSKWRTVAKVVLPTAMAGIVTGVMLAIARVIGETAPLLITTGAFSSVNLNPFDGRMANLPVFTYTQYKFPGVPPEPFIERAWGAALVLIIIVMVLFLAARLVSRRYGIELRK